MISKYLTTVWTPFVPWLVQSYMDGDMNIRDFVHWDSTLASIQSCADARIFSPEKRTILVDVLSRQYAGIQWSQSKVLDNISSLADVKTFTITTGQQVHAFLWPVFFVTKILDCIATAEQVTKESNDKKFVPIFWMASEDHDFAEVSHVSVYGESFDWTVSDVWGPVGRLSPASLEAVVQALHVRLDATQTHTKYLDMFAYAYSHFSTLAQSTHYILDQLFGDRWLVVIDGDDPRLKSLFAPIMHADIFADISTPAIVAQTNKLVTLWYKKQAHPREINVFFMMDNHRWRIIKKDIWYAVDGTDQVFTQEELRSLLEQHPESFSPNVFLRPLYQETILPNVLYIPGPAEFNYWLQMKELFAVHGLVMPVVIPRTFNQFIGIKNYEKITEGPISVASYFSSYNDFLATVRSLDTHTLSDVENLISSLESDLTAIQQKFTDKRITHKKITKSLANIHQELSTLHHVVDTAATASIEESENYAPYIKIKQKFFSDEDRFERNNFVVGQLSVVDELLQKDVIDSSLGKVLLYIY